MPLEIGFMEEDDIPAFAAVDAAAMADWGLAKAMDAASTGGEPRQQLIERMTRHGFRNDSELVWLKVTDTETGEMVAAALWHFRVEAQKPKEEASAPAAEVSFQGAGVKEEEEALQRPSIMTVMGEMGEELKTEFVGASPHANLSILVTHPKHQRRGAGSMLIRWGCDKADERGLMCVLTASEAGLHVYQKHGFVVVKETPLDLRPFGVDETELRRYMVRQASAKS